MIYGSSYEYAPRILETEHYLCRDNDAIDDATVVSMVFDDTTCKFL